MLPFNKELKTPARELRKNMTEAERHLWSKIRRKQLQGYQFYRQKNIVSYIVDFYCPATKLVIEIDGGQHYTEAGKRKDRGRDDYLKTLGLTVLRFSDTEVLKNTNSVLERIYAYMYNPLWLLTPDFWLPNNSMKFIADFHIHSHLSRATSREMNLENIYKWAQLKGVTVVGTGDFTNPKWFKELSEKLEPAEPGLFVLKPQYRQAIDEEIPESCRALVRFILSVEISSIYKKYEKTRKVHNLIFFPDLRSVARLNAMLTKVGNLSSDGRPILGLDSKELLRMALDASHETYFVPAHIWTPHFSVLGANSGFDSLEECFEDLTPLVHAIETGLSSDPPMNWRLSALDKVTLISNSDAHSPDRIGREANIFFTELSYFSILDALNNPVKGEFLGTIEFFPEEGKYHFDGHRACGERLSPAETIKQGGMCPKCGKKVTVGVMHRVIELADRPSGFVPDGKPAFKSLIGLTGVIGEIQESGVRSQKVQKDYFRLLRLLGNELFILRECPLVSLKNSGLTLLPEAINKVRKGEVSILPGYDGEYGKVKVFNDKEKNSKQLKLF